MPPAPTGPLGRNAQPWDLTHRAYNTWDGTTGGIFVEDPGMAEPGSVRAQFALDTYSGHSFLYSNDHVQQDRQSITASWTAIDRLEIYGGIQNRATVADKPKQNSLHSLGDALVGFKYGAPVGSVLRLGVGPRLLMQGDVGAQNTILNAASFGLRGSAAVDLQGLDQPIPFIARFNVDYLFDNSHRVLDDIEDKRYASLQNPIARPNEVRNLVTRVERFGLGVNRVDMFTLAAGFEVPLQLADRFLLHPLLDFRLGMPINRQGYNCAYHSSDKNRGTNRTNADDTCLADAGSSAWPVTLALGARVVPPVRGLSALLAVDLALSGSDTFVRELAPVAPFRVIVAVGYDYDARPAPPPPPPPAPPAPPPAAPKGRLIGTVSDQATGQPIIGAVVRIDGSERTPLATDERGHFVSYELDPGEFELGLSHPDYEPRRCAGAIPPNGGDATVVCTLSALPLSGSLKGTIRDQFGSGVPRARIQITGPSTANASSDPNGDFSLGELPPGEYTARIEADGYFARVARFSLDRRQQLRIEFAVSHKPAKPSVTMHRNELRTNLKFVGDSVDLGPDAAGTIAELADLLLRDPSSRRLRIHGDGGEGLALTRALAIKQRLIEAGVPEFRLEAATEPAHSVTLTWVE